MKLQTIIYVKDMAAAVAFYERLGLERANPGPVDAFWNEFQLDGGSLALHHADDELSPVSSRSECWLQVPADGSLERILASCQAAGDTVLSGVDDLGFGRFIRLADPDGFPVQVGEAPA